MEEIDRMIYKVSADRAILLEEMIKLHLQPKPKFIPRFIWLWVIKHLIIISSEVK